MEFLLRKAIFSLLLVVFFISQSSCTVNYHHYSHENYATDLFQKFDHNQDSGIDFKEFESFFLSFLANDEKPYFPLNALPKIFSLLDMDNDQHLSSEEFRKIVKHWALPLISPKSCLFLCLPTGSANQTDLVNTTTQIILQNKAIFELSYVYVSSCHVDPRIKQTKQIVQHIQRMLPNSYAIKIYSLGDHRQSIRNKNFDQFVVNLANINYNLYALDELMSINSDHQHPTIFVTDLSRSDLPNYLTAEQMHSSIVVTPNLASNPQERVRYKMNLAMILARNLYRKYKQYN